MSSRVRPSARASKAKTVRLQGGALRLGEESLPLYSGAFHYFRHDRQVWQRALEALAALGLPMVESYVPWNVHELSEGVYDFGQHDPRKDLAAFIELAGSLGLRVFLRPGPHINAELTYFGIPHRVLFDETCQARSPGGHPVVFIAPPAMFPVPSHASERYLEQVGRWYRAVGEVIAPHVWPKGPVALLQVDNEAAFFFRDGPYDQDYHPDALEGFRRFVRTRHRSLQAAGQAHGQQYARWSEVTPPTRCDARTAAQLPLHLDWMAFQEELISSALRRMRESMATAGMQGVPVVHNLPMGEGGTPAGLAAVARAADVAGLDYYHSRAQLRLVKQRTLKLAGSTPLPYAPELGVGAPPFFAPRSHEDAFQAALCACAYGLRGFNLYMLMDRDRWYGAPLDARGRPRPTAGDWRRLMEALRRHRFHTLQRRAQVVLMIPREYVHLSRATHLLGAISPSLLDLRSGRPNDACRHDDFGWREPVQLRWWRVLTQVAAALDAAGIPYVYAESEADLRHLADARVLITPTYEMVSHARWKTLERFAHAGGHVVYGPLHPQVDTRMTHQTLPPPANSRNVRMQTRADATRVVEDLLQDVGLQRPFPTRPAGVDSCVHEDASGPRLLFLVQPARQSVEAEVTLPFPLALVDVLNGTRYEGRDTLRIPLEGRSCRMFAIEPKKQPSSRPPSSRPRARRARS